MSKAKPIAETCRLYIKTVYPNVELSGIQKEEIRRAYHAGALYWSEILREVSAIANEHDAVEFLARFHNELREFGESIGPNRLANRSQN